jgi:hypothetical protein
VLPVSIIRAIALMMVAGNVSETPVNLYQTIGCNNPEDSQLHIRRRENLKCHHNSHSSPDIVEGDAIKKQGICRLCTKHWEEYMC